MESRDQLHMVCMELFCYHSILFQRKLVLQVKRVDSKIMIKTFWNYNSMEVCVCVFVYLWVLMELLYNGGIILNYTAHVSIKTSESGMGYLFWSCWLIVSHKPQALQVIVSTLGYPLDLDGKTLRLKIPHIWATESGEIKQILCIGMWFYLYI